MKHSLDQLLHDLTPQQQKDFLEYAHVALTLYRKYATLLNNASFRASLQEIDPNVGALLHMIYDTKHVSWKVLAMRANKQQMLDETLQVTSSHEHHVSEKIKWHTHAPIDALHQEEIWLEVRGGGNIYKRTLEKDIDLLCS